MQHKGKWNNWPILLIGLGLISILIFLSYKLEEHRILSTYTVDLASALSAIIISIATYDEWERRQERKRYC
jgi:hypothetical protein